MSWWTWLGGGLLLLTIEMLTPGSLWWIFFAVGAMVTTVAVLAFPTAGFAVQGLVFVATSTISLALFRKPLLRWLESRSPQSAPIDTLVGEVAVSLNEISPGSVGRAELRGTAWSVTNGSDLVISAAQRCRVERVDGLMLWIRGEA